MSLLLAAVAFASWLVLLLIGFSAWGGTHLLLLASLALYARRPGVRTRW